MLIGPLICYAPGHQNRPLIMT